MESVLGRYRNLIILMGVLFLQVLGLAVQVKRGNNEAQDTRLIRVWAVDALAPFERGLVWIQSSTGNLWHDYVYLRGVRAENRQLKEQIEQMRLEQVRLSEDAAQAQRLQNLLAFKEQFVAKTVAAQVIGTSGSDFSRVLFIDRGENYRLSRDMAVITPDGIVGKIVEVYPSVSKVLLINDQTSGVGTLVGSGRLQGVLRGTANGELQLDLVMSDEQVTPGETVLTSGGDQIFPKGLPVGTVTKVGTGKDLFLNIKIKPAADLSRLEEVLVLVEKQEKQATAEDAVHVRAADILAQRLPSVPDKPAVPEAGATGTSSAAKTAAPGSATANSETKPKGTLATSASLPAKNSSDPSARATPITPKKSAKVPDTASQKPAPASSITLAPGNSQPAAAEPKPAAPPAIQQLPPADDSPQ